MGGGCFWCIEAAFSKLKGVNSVISGYSGGTQANPTYEEVSSSQTGHAEVVKIEFNPAIISYPDLLEAFFALHDPTALNHQDADIGTQYRSIILYTNEEQGKAARELMKKLSEDKIFTNPIATEIKPLEEFFPAEDHHQKYFEKNPAKAYCQINIPPKIGKLKEKFGALMK